MAEAKKYENKQEAPYPYFLQEMVQKLVHRPRWVFTLEDIDRGQGSKGLTLIIQITGPDSYDHTKKLSVFHYFPVPPASYDERSWRRWLFNQCCAVSLHEEMEFFTIDGDKPMAPHHFPGADPYTVFEIGTDEERRTSFRGVLDA